MPEKVLRNNRRLALKESAVYEQGVELSLFYEKFTR